MTVNVRELMEVLMHWEVPKKVFTLNELDHSLRRLEEQMRSSVEVVVLGRSREGRPIEAVQMGDGDQTAIWYGFPHANEPFGGTTIISLIHFLLEHPIGQLLMKSWRWILIPCIDPDGAQLNEPWITKYPDFLSYLRSAHRGLPTDQVEWTFPINHPLKKFDSPLPETKILMNLFKKDVRYLHSIHGNLNYGLYGYVSHYHPLMPEVFERVMETYMQKVTIPPPEFDFVKEHSKGLYSTYSLVDILENGEDPSNIPSSVGECAMGYFLQQQGSDAMAFISEVPMMENRCHPYSDDFNLFVKRRQYYRYWKAKFQDIVPLIQKLWADLEGQLSDSRVKRLQEAFVSDVISIVKTSEKDNSVNGEKKGEKLLSYQEFLLSQVYYFRKILNIHHNFEWLREQQPDVMVDADAWKQFEKHVRTIEVEVAMTLHGLQFVEVQRIGSSQLILGLCYQLLSVEAT